MKPTLTPTKLNLLLVKNPVIFGEVIEVIDSHFNFSSVAFKNGNTYNQKDTNNGSCKIFSYAKLHQLSQQATLNAFGDFYTVDVLENPDSDDHANIRNFIKTGWEGIQFEGTALQPKEK